MSETGFLIEIQQECPIWEGSQKHLPCHIAESRKLSSIIFFQAELI